MTTPDEHPLDLSPEAFRVLVEKATAALLPHLASLSEQPAAVEDGGAEAARALREPLPEAGAPFDELLRLLLEEAVPQSFNTAGPGYLAYVPGGGILHAAVADLLSNAFNRFVGVWAAAPVLVEIEANVGRWLAQIIGFPDGSAGLLTSGGSIANLIALTTARRERLPDDFLSGTLYTSDQAHHSVIKAALLAGFPVDSIRVIPSDEQFRIRTDVLAERILADRADGREPFCVVAHGGTTNTGGVDDLRSVAEIARREKLWFHVDAAYGGFFCLTERGHAALAGIEQADSVTLDPHKGLFLPYGTGALVVRDPETLRRTHAVHADYMPSLDHDDDFLDFCELSPELSRDFRGLRVWLPIKMHGIGAFRDALDEKLDLARRARREIAEIEHLRVLAEPVLSLVVFRLQPPGCTDEEIDRLNREFLRRINSRRRVFLTGTMLDGVFALRICVLSIRTHAERMDMAMEDLRAAAAEVL